MKQGYYMIDKVMKAIRKVFSNNMFIMGILWKISQVRFIIKILLTIISSVLPTIKIIIVRYILTLLEQDDIRTVDILRRVTIAILLLTTVQLGTKLFFDFNSVLMDPFLAAKVNEHMNNIFFEKAKEFEYKNFEELSFYDKYTSISLIK